MKNGEQTKSQTITINIFPIFYRNISTLFKIKVWKNHKVQTITLYLSFFGAAGCSENSNDPLDLHWSCGHCALFSKILSQQVQKQSFAKFFQVGALKNFANFTRKHLYWSLFLIKLQAFRLYPCDSHQRKVIPVHRDCSLKVR